MPGVMQHAPEAHHPLKRLFPSSPLVSAERFSSHLLSKTATIGVTSPTPVQLVMLIVRRVCVCVCVCVCLNVSSLRQYAFFFFFLEILSHSLTYLASPPSRSSMWSLRLCPQRVRQVRVSPRPHSEGLCQDLQRDDCSLIQQWE